jgi:hypothetical protein
VGLTLAAARCAGQSGGVGTEAVAGVGRGNGPVSGGGGFRLAAGAVPL